MNLNNAQRNEEMIIHMCGIVGFIGSEDPKEILLKGLEKLEYRGYDSAGIAVGGEEGVSVFKEKGRIQDLRSVVDQKVTGTVGVGHTRWATHGEPNQRNAHPHQSEKGRFTLVHNGVIENYEQIKDEYLQAKPLKSETDTEIIVQLVERFVDEGNSTEDAFKMALKKLMGSYAIAMIDSQDTNAIYVAKNKSPLLIGLGDGFNVVASDAMAMLQVTDSFVEIMDKEVVVVKGDSVSIQKLSGEQVERAPYTPSIDASDIEKGVYAHYMLKEIDEQPFVIRKIVQNYQNAAGEIEIDRAVLESVAAADRVYIIACGTSYHAGLVGKQYLERISGIPTEVHIASEFTYNMPLLSKNPLFIFISQSGETADSRAVLVNIKKLGHKAITLTNVPSSTLSREADATLALYAGPEIAVASTKAYTAQMAVLLLLAEQVQRHLTGGSTLDVLKELAIAANAIEALCADKVRFEAIAREYLSNTRNAFFIGRAIDYYVCLEAALKLKEISYIQTEGFAAGELKHGTIALIEKGTPVFAIITQADINLNTRGNVKEVTARGASACVIAMEGLNTESDAYVLPKVHELISPILSVIPAQLISYYAALQRGCDVDKPRNLAKSVTVE
jgi:glucosamine--fructose-6-phosphate aminotransferase (isomerizing)